MVYTKLLYARIVRGWIFVQSLVDIKHFSAYGFYGICQNGIKKLEIQIKGRASVCIFMHAFMHTSGRGVKGS